MHLNGLFRGTRRYEIIKNNVKNEVVNIFVGMFFYNFIIDIEAWKTFPLDSVEVSKLRSTEKKPCDQKFEKFDKILIRQTSNVVIQDICDSFCSIV